jgi:uncharacterized protein (TIGR02147 family)
MLTEKTEVSTSEILATAAEALSPLLYLDYKKYLKDLYLLSKNMLASRGKKYSYLQYSNDLGFSKSNVVHLMIQGKRPLSKKSGKKISDVLQLQESKKIYFEALVFYHNEKDAQERENLFELLLKIKGKDLFAVVEKNQLEYFSEWFHPVIRELVSQPEFQENSNWISDRVFPKIKAEQARKSIYLLEQLKLIVRSEVDGKLKLGSTHVTAPEHAATIAIVRYHQKLIELGRESLLSSSASERNVSSVCFSLTETQFKKVTQEISDFRKKMISISEEISDDKKRIYALNFQLFPVSK